MQQQPTVSVIICFLNPGDWLREAVDSVIAQTFTDWELILVDDGSVESDTRLARHYVDACPKKIFYREHEDHQNIGLPKSRNVGISASRGRYVAFLDADDKWMPKKLEAQLDILSRHPEVSVLLEASLFWYSWSGSPYTDTIYHVGVEEGVYVPPQLFERLYPIGDGQPPCPTGIIMTSEALKEVNNFEEGFSGVFTLYEDQAFLSKVYLTQKVYVSHDANNIYRKREGSMSDAANDEALYKKVRQFYIDWLEQYVIKKDINLPGVRENITAFRKRLA
jgi:glycosyltransferase involved in cell wall biosynthesis